MTLLQRMAQRLGLWTKALADYLLAPSCVDFALFNLPQPPALEPADEQPRRVVLVGGPFHMEAFTLPANNLGTTALSLHTVHESGAAWYLRRAGDIDPLGRERWHYDRSASQPSGAAA